MTRKLYYEDSHLKTFTACVINCRLSDDKNRYEIILDKTAFFPEGGGQSADTGVLGEANVLDVQEIGQEIIHYTDSPLEIGNYVEGKIDWENRFSNMQNHSGEHILSGVINNIYGYNNVGFHMGEKGVIVDFDGYLTKEQLSEIELIVNKIIYENRPVTAKIYTPEEVSEINFRSKKELKGDIRIVTIEGCDCCACCAPHVSSTAEIGILKIVDSCKRKNGVRLRMLAGISALEDFRSKQDTFLQISKMLSSNQENMLESVSRLLNEISDLRYSMVGVKRRLIDYISKDFAGETRPVLIFESDFSMDELKLLCNKISNNCNNICALFSGNDSIGYKYILASDYIDVLAISQKFNNECAGHGGGSSKLVQGNVKTTEVKIRGYFEKIFG